MLLRGRIGEPAPIELPPLIPVPQYLAMTSGYVSTDGPATIYDMCPDGAGGLYVIGNIDKIESLQVNPYGNEGKGVHNDGEFVTVVHISRTGDITLSGLSIERPSQIKMEFDGSHLYVGGIWRYLEAATNPAITGGYNSKAIRIDTVTWDYAEINVSGYGTDPLYGPRMGVHDGTLFAVMWHSGSGSSSVWRVVAINGLTGAVIWDKIVTRSTLFTPTWGVHCAGADVYLFGDFTAVGGTSATGIVRLDKDTGALKSFPVVVDGNITDAIHIPDSNLGNIVVMTGDFNTVNGDARPRIAAVDAETGILINWSPSTYGTGATAVSGTRDNVGVIALIGGTPVAMQYPIDAGTVTFASYRNNAQEIELSEGGRATVEATSSACHLRIEVA